MNINEERIYNNQLPWCFSDKESTFNTGATGDISSIPGSGRSPGGEYGNPLQYFCLENPHGLMSLVSYHSQGGKESDMKASDLARMSTVFKQ